MNIIEWITQNAPMLLAIVGGIEAILRLIPTTRNLSIIDKIFGFIRFIIPNRIVTKKFNGQEVKEINNV